MAIYRHLRKFSFSTVLAFSPKLAATGKLLARLRESGGLFGLGNESGKARIFAQRFQVFIFRHIRDVWVSEIVGLAQVIHRSVGVPRDGCRTSEVVPRA
jgi:hypothetical protein